MRSILFALAALASLTVAAQTGTLSLSEAVNIALDNNLRLQQEQNNLMGSQALLNASKFSLAPSINARASAAQQNGNSFNQQEGQVVNGTINYISGSIGANMDLFRGLSNYNNLRSAQNNFESQEHTVERTRQVIISDVSSQYLQALLSQVLFEIEKENLAFQEKMLGMIEDEVRLGSKAEVEKFNQISLVKNSELTVLRAEVQLRNNKTTLAQTLLIDPTAEFELSEPELGNSFSEMQLAELDINQSAGLRDDVISARLLQQASKYRMMSTRSAVMPSLAAFANYGSAYNDIVGFDNRTFDQQFFMDNTYVNYGVSLNVPIFNGMFNRSQIVRDKVSYENAILATKDREINAKSEIQRAMRNYQDAIKSYELATAAMEAAEVSFRLNEESYRLGLISIIEFSQSNRDYFRARSDMASASLTIVFQEILLKAALGTLSPEDILD